MGSVDLDQASTVRRAHPTNVIRIVFPALLLLCTYNSLAGSRSDTVNERIPVRTAELEAHWKIDCASAWRDLTDTIASPETARGLSGEYCNTSDELRRTLELCAHIYQPPGETSTQHCPDYRGISELLSPRQDQSKCAHLKLYIENQKDCLPPASGEGKRSK